MFDLKKKKISWSFKFKYPIKSHHTDIYRMSNFILKNNYINLKICFSMKLNIVSSFYC